MNVTQSFFKRKTDISRSRLLASNYPTMNATSKESLIHASDDS